MDAQLYSHFLPAHLLDYFTIITIKEEIDKSDNSLALYIELEEKNIVPPEYNSEDYESKGFYPTKAIQDFPIRGKAVYLLIKRRRWRHKINKNDGIHTNFTFMAKGTKLTLELSDFLKDTDKY